MMLAATEQSTLMLLDAGASPAARDSEGRTALMHILKKGSFNGYGNRKAVLERLVDKGADLNAIDHRGYPAFMYASHPDPALVSFLLGRNADLTARGPQGETALIAFAKSYARSGPELIVMLATAGVDVSARDSDGNTALIWFAAAGSFLAGDKTADDLVKAAKSRGTDLNAVNNAGQTALVAAINAISNLPFAEALIRSGADVNVRDRDGKTALYYAKSRVSIDEFGKQRLMEKLRAAKAIE
jgi:ankyrin repeat protein